MERKEILKQMILNEELDVGLSQEDLQLILRDEELFALFEQEVIRFAKISQR